MITYKDCPECGARKIHSTVRLCEICETCEKYETTLEDVRATERERWREIASLTNRLEQAIRERDEAVNTMGGMLVELDDLRAEVTKLRAALDRAGL